MQTKKEHRWVPDKPPQVSLRATGRCMVEVEMFINDVRQPIPPQWIEVIPKQSVEDIQTFVDKPA